MPQMWKVAQHSVASRREYEWREGERRRKTSSSETRKWRRYNDTRYNQRTDTPYIPTAIVKIIGGAEQTRECNVLSDSGSQSNFMTASLCAKLGLRTVKADISVSGINQVETKVLETTRARIKSMHCDFEEELVFMVVPKITARLPSEPLKFRRADIPSDISLADPDFYKPKRIDLLIGVDLFWDLIDYEPSEHPHLRKTKLGYVIAGKLPSRDDARVDTKCHLITDGDGLSRCLQQFWEVEELPSEHILSSEEQACETHFTKTTKRSTDGRFIVSIPFKAPIDELGDSHEMAERRLKSLERRLQRDRRIRDHYTAFLRKYEELGHMTRVPDDERASPTACYLPHHGVMKETSLTTKLRVVFNASAPTSTGVSINDLQMVGPTIQRDILSILLSFKQHPYVIGADITMMYRQVLIEPSQRPLQRILWRENSGDPITEYQLNTITYGMASSSFLAIRCLFSLAEEHQGTLPEAADIIRNCMYVDDLLFGAPTREKASQLADNVSRILATGCFELRKWISNDPQTLTNIDSSNCIHELVKLGESESTKTLGLSWSSAKDELVYHVEVETDVETATKRSILSLIARIFDPLGMLGPSVIIAKIMQQLWKLKLSWDDPLPEEMHSEWRRFVKDFDAFNNLRIMRQVCCTSPRHIEIHGFSDASEKAYGTCIYVRSTSMTGRTFVQLLCAKTKVAPVKALTIPKLELSAAHLMLKLMTKVKASLSLNIDDVYYWSDSSIVLRWIRMEPCQLQTFVRNRVVDIQASSSAASWRHVPSTDNPADLASRGVLPKALMGRGLWWNGPSWLKESKKQWPEHIDEDDSLPRMEETAVHSSVVSHVLKSSAILKFTDHSKVGKMARIIAYCLRYINIIVHKISCKGPFTAEEIQQAMIVLIRLAQRESFSDEIYTLSRDKTLNTRSKMHNLKGGFR